MYPAMKVHIIYSESGEEVLVLGGTSATIEKRRELIEATGQPWYWRSHTIRAQHIGWAKGGAR